MRHPGVVSGANCGLELDGTGPFLVFASIDDSTTTPTATPTSTPAALTGGSCGGTHPLSTCPAPAAVGEGDELAAQPIVTTNMPYDGSNSSFLLNALLLLIGLLTFWSILGPVVVQQRRKRVPNGAES